MKKTYNINLSGYPFTIDEDAYDILESYLGTLLQICERTGQRETAIDIEQRVAEIFSEKCASGAVRVITRTDVEEVIARIGAPEDIVEIDVETGSPEPRAAMGTPPPQTPPPYPYQTPPVHKRLYRDIDHKVFGGVCSGLAWYLGVDVVWVRIAMVLLALVTGSTMVVVYLVLWAVIPPAKSPYERMQMMGVNPSLGNVGKVVTGAWQPAGPNCQPDPSCGVGGENAGSVILLIFTVLGLLVAGSLLLALSLVFVGSLIAVCVAPGSYADVGQAKLILGCVMGGSLVVGIPLYLLFMRLLNNLTEKKYISFTSRQLIFLAIPWLLGVAACIVCGILLG